MEPVYYGEKGCSSVLSSGKNKGEPCKNKAYFITDDGILYCGMHSKQKKVTELKKNPNRKAAKIALDNNQAATVSKATTLNKKNNRRGIVTCTKMYMLKNVDHVEGYLSVFPNYKHGNRKDGLGLPSLSPMILGPVEHHQPGLPEALNLENFWQGSKMYEDQSLEEFRQKQKELFEDIEPHRHNRKGEKPKGWLWTFEDGTTQLFSYVESRQFYCTFYERLVKKTDEWKMLLEKLENGTNLNIVGYDGINLFRETNKSSTQEELLKLYLDETRPFGHELVLVSMLVLKEEEYSWNIHKTVDF